MHTDRKGIKDLGNTSKEDRDQETTQLPETSSIAHHQPRRASRRLNYVHNSGVIVLLSAAWGLASGVRNRKWPTSALKPKMCTWRCSFIPPTLLIPRLQTGGFASGSRRSPEWIPSPSATRRKAENRQSGSRSLPALLPLQIARGVVWVAVLFPCLRRIESRGRAMLVLAVGATTLGALAPLAAPNNLIPLKIRLWHMLEMTGSHTAFGVFTA